MTKNVLRVLTYPALALAMWWFFFAPTSQQSADGFYPTTPSTANIVGGYGTGEWLVPGVMTEPSSLGATAVQRVVYNQYWDPDSQYYIGKITAVEAQEITSQWQRSREVAEDITGMNLPITWLHPQNATGASFGLASALATIDTLGEGDLTGNQTAIAATGTVFQGGTVGPIGGVDAKLLGIQSTDARIFFVPASNYGEISSPLGDVTVVPVNTVQEALTYLCDCPELQVTDTVCDKL